MTSRPNPHDSDAPELRFGLTAATRHFVRHYSEMVAAMSLGMVVLVAPAGWALSAAGSSLSELKSEAPSLMFLGMAFTMTAPMVAWMRFRGHGRRVSTEMAASMVLPTLAAITLLDAGAMNDIEALVLIEHVATLGMLVAMLLRPDEYRHPHAHPHTELQPATA